MKRNTRKRDRRYRQTIKGGAFHLPPIRWTDPNTSLFGIDTGDTNEEIFNKINNLLDAIVENIDQYGSNNMNDALKEAKDNIQQFKSRNLRNKKKLDYIRKLELRYNIIRHQISEKIKKTHNIYMNRINRETRKLHGNHEENGVHIIPPIDPRQEELRKAYNFRQITKRHKKRSNYINKTPNLTKPFNSRIKNANKSELNRMIQQLEQSRIGRE